MEKRQNVGTKSAIVPKKKRIKNEYLNEVVTKFRTFDVRCIVKWGVKIDKIIF